MNLKALPLLVRTQTPPCVPEWIPLPHRALFPNSGVMRCIGLRRSVRIFLYPSLAKTQTNFEQETSVVQNPQNQRNHNQQDQIVVDQKMEVIKEKLAKRILVYIQSIMQETSKGSFSRPLCQLPPPTLTPTPAAFSLTTVASLQRPSRSGCLELHANHLKTFQILILVFRTTSTNSPRRPGSKAPHAERDKDTLIRKPSKMKNTAFLLRTSVDGNTLLEPGVIPGALDLADVRERLSNREVSTRLHLNSCL